jgi:hypothetical protein
MQPNCEITQQAVCAVAGVRAILAHMMTKSMSWLCGAVLLVSIVAFSQTSPRSTSPSTPEYTNDARLKFPTNYREWVYLTSGFDMSYNPAAMAMDHSMFDNVFVNPDAYKTFVETGKWPDKTMLVLELRRAKNKGSINQKGSYQDSDVMGIEVHVKDESKFDGKWAFFGFGGNDSSARMTPKTADCYSCHADHGAVDTTFVQFYPTLLPIARSKATLAAAYLKETAGEK